MSNKKSFEGKTCWVTGASSGIGAAIALELNKQGANLIISARNQDNLEKVRINCPFPDKITVLVCDMEDSDQLPDKALEAWNMYNGIDYAFLNAGMAVRDMLINIKIELIRKVMNTNFFGAAIIAKALLPLMLQRKAGHFAVTSSLSGKYGIPKLSAYAAAKHALHGLFESMRAEHEKDGIKVSMVIPGLIKTGISEHSLLGDGTVSGKTQEAIKAGISPQVCATGILKGVLKEKHEIVVGGSERYSVLINRLFPGLMAYVIRNHPLKKLRDWGFIKKSTA